MCAVCGFSQCPGGCPNAPAKKESSVCPVCGKVPDLHLYLSYGEIIGCDQCIKEVWWDEV